MSLSPKASREIHSEDNRVYFHPSVGFYVVTWFDTGNSEIPTVIPVTIPPTQEKEHELRTTELAPAEGRARRV